jgi:simple sugar transport system ATP-binding protein
MEEIRYKIDAYEGPLDVLLALADRILVLCGGRQNGILDARTVTKEEVGRRMTNLVSEEAAA